MKLTIKEKSLITTLGRCYTEFLQLDNLHPNDAKDFCDRIHTCQQQVMARLARRVHPETFTRSKEIE